MNNPAIFQPIPEAQANEKVYAKATYFETFVRVYIPNEPYQKLQEGLEEIPQEKFKSTKIKDPEQEPYETNIERSLRRTRKSIKDYALNNDFDFFCSFTFKEDRYDIDRCKQKMTNWLKNESRHKGKFEYLIVSEFHKDQKALHFHALIQGYKGEIRRATHKDRPLSDKTGKPVFEFPSYTLGHNNVKKTRARPLHQNPNRFLYPEIHYKGHAYSLWQK